MGSATAGGVISISIDADGSGQAAPRRDAIEHVLVRLADELQRHRIAATWAFADPAGSSLARRRITEDAARHEVALLGNTALAQGTLSRTDIAETIGGPLHAAEAAGIKISTVAIGGAWRPQHIDLLAKHGITMVRAQGRLALGDLRQGISKLDGVGVRAVCHGLWHVPVSAALNGGGWIANLLQLVAVRRAIRAAATRGGLCHLQIDAAAIAAGEVSQAMRAVDCCLRYVSGLRDAGRIGVETLRDTALRLMPKRAAAARSILRAA